MSTPEQPPLPPVEVPDLEESRDALTEYVGGVTYETDPAPDAPVPPDPDGETDD